MRVRLEIKNLGKIERELELLSLQIQRQIVRRALRRAGEVFRRELRTKIAALDLDAGAKQKLRRGIRIRSARHRWLPWHAVQIRMVHDGMPAWHWLEHGTAERHRPLETEYDFVDVHRRSFLDSRSRTGKWRRATSYKALRRIVRRSARTGQIKPQPFVAPALAAAVDEALRVLDEELKRGIEDAWTSL